MEWGSKLRRGQVEAETLLNSCLLPPSKDWTDLISVLSLIAVSPRGYHAFHIPSTKFLPYFVCRDRAHNSCFFRIDDQAYNYKT